MGRIISQTVHKGVYSVNKTSIAPVSANSKVAAGKSSMPKGKNMPHMKPAPSKIKDKLESSKSY